MNIFPNFENDLAQRRTEIERTDTENMLARAKAAKDSAERQRQIASGETAAWLAATPLREHREKLAKNFRLGLRESAANLLKARIRPHVRLITVEEVEGRRILSIVMSKTVKKEALGWVLWDHSASWTESGSNSMDSNNGGFPGDSGYRRDLTILSETGEVAWVTHKKCRPLERPFDTVLEPIEHVTFPNDDQLLGTHPITTETRLEDIPRVNSYYYRIIDIAAGLRTEKVS